MRDFKRFCSYRFDVLSPPLYALILLLLGGADAADARQPEPTVVIERTEPTVERILFDPRNPPTDMPKLEPNEAALCQFNFNCTVALKYEIIDESADPQTSVAAQIRQIKVTLKLHNKIYLPRGAPPKIRAHEEGHRIINERVYENAEKIARAAAMDVVTQTWRGGGADSSAAGKAATDRAVQKLCEQYLTGTAGKASRIGDIYDDLTDHGRNLRLSEADAIRRAFSQFDREKSAKQPASSR